MELSKGVKIKEGLMVCGDRNLGVGLTIWDTEAGDLFLHIPTCLKISTLLLLRVIGPVVLLVL